MTDEEQAIERVRKLLALSESSNKSEATLAAVRACELIRKHKLLDKPGKSPDNLCRLLASNTDDELRSFLMSLFADELRTLTCPTGDELKRVLICLRTPTVPTGYYADVYARLALVENILHIVYLHRR